MRCLLLFLCALATALATPASPPKPPVGVPVEAAYFSGKWYRVYFEKVPWNRAAERCKLMGGQLMIVRDAESWQFVRTLTDASIWLGATDERVEGVWRWMDGTVVTFAPWATKEPSNTGGVENYLASSRLGWRDMPNSGVVGDFRVAGFICEWTPPVKSIATTLAAQEAKPGVAEKTAAPETAADTGKAAPSQRAAAPQKPTDPVSVVVSEKTAAPEKTAVPAKPATFDEAASDDRAPSPEESAEAMAGRTKEHPATSALKTKPVAAVAKTASPGDSTSAADEDSAQPPEVKRMPFLTTVDEVGDHWFIHKNKNGTKVVFVVTDKTVVKQSGAEANFAGVQVGDTISGVRIKAKEDGTEYEVVKISKFGRK